MAELGSPVAVARAVVAWRPAASDQACSPVVVAASTGGSVAREIRELEAQEERLVDLTLKKLVTPSLLEKKANALRAERDRAEQRLLAARSLRTAALRAGAESASVKRLLGSLRKQAEAIGTDDSGRALIVRTVAKGIVTHRTAAKSRLEVTYAFQGSEAASRPGATEPSASSASLATQTA